MELTSRLKKTLVSSDSWYLGTGQDYLLDSLVGNFRYFSFEMEVQDGAPCSLKDTVSHNSWFYLAAPLRDNFNWSKIPQNLKVFKVVSTGLKYTQLLGLKFSTSNWILGS
jgi:hypothetical protein